MSTIENGLAAVPENGFEKYIRVLKEKLSYAEGRTFSWDNVVSILVLK